MSVQSRESDPGDQAASPPAGHPVGMGLRGGPGFAPPPTFAIRGTFRALQVRSFRFLWLGMLCQMGAMMMQQVARSWFVYDLTGSGALLGLVSSGFALPLLLLAPFGGVIADRVEKKRVIQGGQAAGAALALYIALMITTGAISWVHLFIASFLQGGIFAFSMPARQAVIPALVGEDRLMNAIALNAMGMSVMTMAAPAVGGFLLAWVGVAGAYYVMTGLGLMAVFFTSFLPKMGATQLRADIPALEDLKDGLRYLRGNRAVMLVLVVSLVTTVLVMPLQIILPIFTTDVFEVGPSSLGILYSTTGGGTLVGSLILASFGRGRKRGLLLLGSAVLSGGAMLAFAATPVFWGAVAMMFLVGLSQAGRMTLGNSLAMELSEDAYRGRIMGVFMMTFGLMPLGVLPITILAGSMGAPQATAIAAVLAILIAAAFWLFSPVLRRVE